EDQRQRARRPQHAESGQVQHPVVARVIGIAASHLRVDQVKDAGPADDDGRNSQVTDHGEKVLRLGHRVAGPCYWTMGASASRQYFPVADAFGGGGPAPWRGVRLPSAQIDLRHLPQTWRSPWPTWLASPLPPPTNVVNS